MNSYTKGESRTCVGEKMAWRPSAYLYSLHIDKRMKSRSCDARTIRTRRRSRVRLAAPVTIQERYPSRYVAVVPSAHPVAPAVVQFAV